MAKDIIVKEKKVFAKGFCFWKIFIFFMLGSVLGVLYEQTLTLIKHGIWQPKVGVFYGPLNPVYGAGVALFILILGKFVDRIGYFSCFIYCAFIGGAVEYLLSILCEKMFHQKSWDYSTLPLNLNGRTSVGIMIIWGFAGMILVKLVYPFVSKLIEKIPYKIGMAVTIFMLVFFIIDGMITVVATQRQVMRHRGYEPQNFIEEFCDEHYTDEFIQKKYPNSVFFE